MSYNVSMVLERIFFLRAKVPTILLLLIASTMVVHNKAQIIPSTSSADTKRKFRHKKENVLASLVYSVQ